MTGKQYHLFATCLRHPGVISWTNMILSYTRYNVSHTCVSFRNPRLVPVSISHNTSYRTISFNIELARIVFLSVVSLSNSEGVSAALPSRSLSNIRSTRQLRMQISRLRDTLQRRVCYFFRDIVHRMNENFGPYTLFKTLWTQYHSSNI